MSAILFSIHFNFADNQKSLIKKIEHYGSINSFIVNNNN